MALVLVGSVLFGAAVAGYNALHYEILQPVPVTWTHLPEEIAVLDLERDRRILVGRMGSAQRVGAIGAARLPIETTEGHAADLRTELAALDRQLDALRTRAAAARAGR
ncbi:MAG TPA: hypothetical protein VLD61_07245 [Methylomirabilota bacterium]|nr:hypothetical protein [Methylomirabilota bacterium]